MKYLPFEKMANINNKGIVAIQDTQAKKTSPYLDGHLYDKTCRAFSLSGKDKPGFVVFGVARSILESRVNHRHQSGGQVFGGCDASTVA